VDAVAILDQVEEEDCGVVTGGLVARLAGRAPRHPNVTFWADSRCRIQRFRNVTIKPNQFEAMGIENPRPGTRVDEAALMAAAESLRAQAAAPVFITRGENGILVSDAVLTAVPGVRIKGPIDTTGAGDSTTAGCLAALAAGATLPEAALVGNLVASITVQQLATTGTARPDHLPARLELWREQNP